MTKTIILLLVVFCISPSFAQVSISNDGSNPDPSAMLDIESTNRGFLPPRMTITQRDAIASPAEGLTIYNLSINCIDFYTGTEWKNLCNIPPMVEGGVPGTFWMDKNLGATQVATSSNDPASYGGLYQWGRATDGHEDRNSSTIATLATTSVPNDGNSWDGLFITTGSSPYDWLTTQDDNLWQGASGTNNPCPSGFRIATEAEWDAERLSWSSQDMSGAFGSSLILPAGGFRDYGSGGIILAGSYATYFTSTVSGTDVYRLSFNSAFALTDPGGYRAYGSSIRCIQD